MNKTLKYTGYSVISIIALFFLSLCIGGIVLPEQQVITCTKDINAPAEIIFKNISDYSQWSKWDAWYRLDTNQKRNYLGTPSTVGHSYSWEGNDKVGKGNMSIAAIETNKKVSIDLHFIKPFESNALVDLTIENKKDVSTVAWIMKTKNSFFFRLISKLMESTIKKDFESGLSNLKIVSEKQATEFAATCPAGSVYEIKETTLNTTNYVILKNMHQSINTISEFFTKEMPKLGEFVQNNKIEVTGPPATFYYTFDKVNGTTDMAISIPIKNKMTVKLPYEFYQLQKTKALYIDYFGDYDKMESAYEAIYAYINEHHLTLNGAAIEEYVGDPMSVNGDMSKCLTKIYVPIK